MNLQERARRFHELHQSGTLVLPKRLGRGQRRAGSPKLAPPPVATTSSGISLGAGRARRRAARSRRGGRRVWRGSRGRSRCRSAPMSRAATVRRRHTWRDTIAAVIDAGAVGVNLEDRRRDAATRCGPPTNNARRLAAARAAGDRGGRPFISTRARTVYLAAVGAPEEREDMTLARAEYHAPAPTACLVPGLADLAVIARLVSRAPLPINIMLMPGP